MSKKSEQTIRSAWSELEYIAGTWDHTAPGLLRDAGKAEARDARSGGFAYPKIEQLAGLCETALTPFTNTASLYGVREGHVKVAIFATAAAQRFPGEYAAWREKYGEEIKAFRRARVTALTA